MIFAQLLVYTSYLFYFSFGTICVASGLYYLADFVEEYTVFSKKLMKYAILGSLLIHVIFLIFEEYAWYCVISGIAANIAYYFLLKPFPVIELTSPLFISSCLLAITNHIFWFRYFTQEYFPFAEVLAIFSLLVWLIPFGFFVSLSANDSALPVSNLGNIPTQEQGDTDKKRKSHSILLSIFSIFSSKKEEGLFGTSSSVKLT